jgi:hypothetical protein
MASGLKAYPADPVTPAQAAGRLLDRPPLDLGDWDEAKQELEARLKADEDG